MAHSDLHGLRNSGQWNGYYFSKGRVFTANHILKIPTDIVSYLPMNVIVNKPDSLFNEVKQDLETKIIAPQSKEDLAARVNDFQVREY